MTKNRKLDFKAMAGLRYEKSVDLIGLAGTSAANRSIVESLNYIGDLQLNYRLGNLPLVSLVKETGHMSMALVKTLRHLT